MHFNKQRGFTLLELLIAITILAILSAATISSYTSVVSRGRDAKRKEDLKQILNALQAYYADNGKYPPAGGSHAGCSAPSGYSDTVTQFGCFDFDNATSTWIPELVPKYMKTEPNDPNYNNSSPSSCQGAQDNSANTVCYKYSYGNVTADGQSFDLLALLEYTNDPARCGVKSYKMAGGVNAAAWCPASAPNQLYQQPVP